MYLQQDYPFWEGYKSKNDAMKDIFLELTKSLKEILIQCFLEIKSIISDLRKPKS